jgi:hypothetical protein
MDVTAFSGAVTIALSSALIFMLVVRSWSVFTQTASSSRFASSIMLESAQRFRDEISQLGRDQSVYLATGLVFAVIFSITYLLPPIEVFRNVPGWQFAIELLLLVLASGFLAYRLARIAVARRRLIFIRDANMSIGHALQRLTMNSNRVFHDVACNDGVIDHVIVGLHGIYAISVIARKTGKDNRARLKGDQLLFAPGVEGMGVARSRRKSEQLAQELKEILGHQIHVRSVIAVPGWEIDFQDSKDYLLVNEWNVAMVSGWKDQKDYLMNEEVDLVQQELTGRCTRFSS